MKLVIHPTQALRGSVHLPGDKSISHRTLIFGAVANGTTVAHNWLDAGVTACMVNCIRALGIVVEVASTGPGRATLTVYGKGLHGLNTPIEPLYCGGSATTMRLLMGILAAQPFTSILDGHNGLRRRPMERIAAPLRQMGATIETTDGHAPLTITGGKLATIDYEMPVASAQLQTALLLASLGAEGQMTLRQPGPARDHTLRMLSGQNAEIREEQGIITFNANGFTPQPLNFTVPGDMSSAAFLMTAGLIVPNADITLNNVNTNHTRAGLLDILQTMGAQISLASEQVQAGEPVANIRVQTSAPLQATEIGGEVVVRMIDEFPIFTVAALQAHGKTIVRDATELRHKESDRIDVVVKEFAKLGATITPHPDGFKIDGPQQLVGATVSSHRDHRLAMSLAVAGLVAKGETIIENAEELNESFPGFVETLQDLGAEIAWVT